MLRRFISVFIVFFAAVGLLSTLFNVAPYVHAKGDKFSDFENFYQAYTLITNKYVDPVETTDLMEGAIEGMLQSLDPHSAYLSPDDYEQFKVGMTGEFGGLGMTIGMKDKEIIVVSPIEDTPAFRAGLKSGDVIIQIDDKKTEGMSTDEAVDLMRGKPKTKVKITIRREGVQEPIVFDLVRDIIKIKSVRHEMIDGDIAYIRHTSFQEGSSDLILKSLKELEKQGAKGVILDLRYNPGGILDQAVEVSSLFLDRNQVVVTTKERVGETIIRTRDMRFRDLEIPLLVLVNEGSASASEIVAGAIQDYSRGIIIGTTTFGKGSVQSLIDLPNGGAVKLTVSRYYTPSGRSIHGTGIKPDVEVKQDDYTDEQIEALIEKIGSDATKREIDTQLKAAIELIKTKY